MRIYIIRHGQTTGDIEKRFGGDYDDPLTFLGKSQAEKLAKKLSDKGIKIIYHSTKIRASRTAEILNNFLRARLQTATDLRERNNYGILTGLTIEEAKKKFPAEVEKLNKDKVNHGILGSEDYSVFKKRVINSFISCIKKEKVSAITIVTHSGPISVLHSEFFKFGKLSEVKDCGILEIDYSDDIFKLINKEGMN